MNFEQAKAIIQDMANGTATAEDEAALEEWALQHIEVDGCYGRMVVLGHSSPRGGGQLHYRSVREAIEQARGQATNWCDVIHIHSRIGVMDDGNDYYAYSVYASEYTESIEREEGGNFVRVDCWVDGRIEGIVQFPCAEGQVKNEGSFEQSGPEYLFERDFVQCESDAQFNSAGMIVACPQCVERAITTGNCHLGSAV